MCKTGRDALCRKDAHTFRKTRFLDTKSDKNVYFRTNEFNFRAKHFYKKIPSCSKFGTSDLYEQKCTDGVMQHIESWPNGIKIDAYSTCRIGLTRWQQICRRNQMTVVALMHMYLVMRFCLNKIKEAFSVNNALQSGTHGAQYRRFSRRQKCFDFPPTITSRTILPQRCRQKSCQNPA